MVSHWLLVLLIIKAKDLSESLGLALPACETQCAWGMPKQGCHRTA